MKYKWEDSESKLMSKVVINDTVILRVQFSKSCWYIQILNNRLNILGAVIDEKEGLCVEGDEGDLRDLENSLISLEDAKLIAERGMSNFLDHYTLSDLIISTKVE